MKKTIIAVICVVATCSAFAQAVIKDTTKVGQATKPVYEKFVPIPVDEYYRLLNTIHSYRDVLIYDPLSEAADKLTSQANIDKYLYDRGKAFRIDSALVKVKK